jgi:hypothetical protein
MDEALKAATHPHDFKLLVASEGQRSTSVEHIYSSEQSGADQPPPDGGNGSTQAERSPVSLTPQQ